MHASHYVPKAGSVLRIAGLVALLLFTLNAAPVTAKNPVAFLPPDLYPTGMWPMEITTGDFNRDGKIDLAVPNYLSETISVYVAAGGGKFLDPINYSTGGKARDAAVGDFNRDGFLDLAVSQPSYPNGSIGILLGTGTGTFQTVVNQPTSPNLDPVFVAAGNFTKDSILDLVVLMHDSGGSPVIIQLGLMVGNGNGTFQPLVPFADIMNQEDFAILIGFTVGDLNQDHHLDLVVAASSSETGQVTVVMGNGNGTFKPKVEYLKGQASNDAAIADFNEDGRADLAVNTGYEDSDISILLGSTGGSFLHVVNIPTSGGYNIQAADIDGDGHMDLVTSPSDYHIFDVLIGNGDGTFQAPMSFNTVCNRSITAGDFNGDQRVDLAMLDTTQEQDLIGIHLNDPVSASQKMLLSLQIVQY